MIKTEEPEELWKRQLEAAAKELARLREENIKKRNAESSYHRSLSDAEIKPPENGSLP